MKKRSPPSDGFGPYERKKLNSAVRQCWYRCKARQLVIKRCTDADGFAFCEKCKNRTPKLKVDHLNPVGEIGGADYIKKMWVSSDKMQGLCKKCHDLKTKLEKKNLKSKANVIELGDENT